MEAMHRLSEIVRDFIHSARGNVAMMFALCAVPITLTVGVAVDIAHQNAVNDEVQNSLDAAILAAASSTANTEDDIEQIIRTYLTSNLTGVDLDDDYTLTVRVDERRIDAAVSGRTPTFFAGVVGRSHLPVGVDAAAMRGGGEVVELVLVVDNTWSMSADAGGGVSRITALRQAARALVNGIMVDGAEVRVALVPYADYVNVGPANRSASWLNVPADYSTTSARVCNILTTRNVCTGGVRDTRTVLVDGVPTPQTYWRVPQTCSVQTVAPYESCSGGSTTQYRWFGCVASRNVGMLRRSDLQPTTRYPGFLGTSQACLNPIVPLTDDRSTILSAIDGLIINIGGYRPETYIPSGLIWGVNVLSPSAPYSEGAAYGDDVRKIIVLMTDGSNTLKYRASDGRHVSASDSSNADTDARAICDYARDQQIQIYTVGLAVPSGAPRDLMRYCASSAANAFDAANASELVEAFQGIARSINAVRLVE